MRRLLLVTVALTLTLCAAAGAKTIAVAPGGNLTAAYNSAAAGDVIELVSGNYGVWTVPTGSKAITVKAAAGAHPVLRQLFNGAANITFDGLDVDAGGRPSNPNRAAFETGGQPNVTFRNGRIGNIIDQKGALLGGDTTTMSLGTVIDNVEFHDVQPVGSSVHNECIFSQAPGVVVRNSTFGATCGNTGAVFLLRGDWWGQPPYGGFTFINNRFARQLFDHGSIIFANACPTVCDRAIIRGNTFDAASMPNTTSDRTFTNSYESCNTPRVDLAGIIHEQCATTPPPPPPPADGDGDGVPDASDACPNTAGSQSDGCNPPPAPAPDTCKQTEAELADAQATITDLRTQVATLTAQRDAARDERDALRAKIDAALVALR